MVNLFFYRKFNVRMPNIFMSFYKSKWLDEYNLKKPKFYLRYVYVILAVFDKDQDSLNF